MTKDQAKRERLKRKITYARNQATALSYQGAAGASALSSGDWQDMADRLQLELDSMNPTRRSVLIDVKRRLLALYSISESDGDYASGVKDAVQVVMSMIGEDV